MALENDTELVNDALEPGDHFVRARAPKLIKVALRPNIYTTQCRIFSPFVNSIWVFALT